jgi:peptide deformylase
MAVRTIFTMGHPALYRTARRVADPTAADVAAVARDMQDTLDDNGAAAIAAPQVGDARRIVVYRLSRRVISDPSAIVSEDWIVMVNPVLTPKTDDTVMAWERCLSIPGLHGKVPRCPAIHVSYTSLDGTCVEHEVDGPVAAMLQHECDHLDGVLYPMRMTDLSLFEFDVTPGRLAEDVDRGLDVWPVLEELVEAWRGNQ